MIWAIINTFTALIALANVYLATRLIRQLATARQVLMVLQMVCVNAFSMREWPIRLAKGFNLKVEITPVWEGDSSDKQTRTEKAERVVIKV